MLGELQRLYEPARTRNKRSLQRVRARLAEQAQQAQNVADAPPSFHAREWRGYTKENRMQPLLNPAPQVRAWHRGTATLAAVVVLVVLVGSMITVFALMRSSKTGVGTNGPGTASQPGLGSTLYTSPASFDAFYALAWSPDSKRVAASTQSNVWLWDATTGQHPLTYTPNGGGGSVLGLSWSPDDKMLAVGAISSDGLEVINPVTGTIIHTFSPGQTAQGNDTGLSPAVSLSGGSGVAAVAWSPNGKFLAAAFFGAAYGNQIVVWDAATGTQVTNFTGHKEQITSLAWSSDSTYIASTSFEGTVLVWKVQTKQVIFSHYAGSAVAWSPTKLQVVFAIDRNTYQVWDVLANKPITTAPVAAGGGIAWSPNGKAIAVGSASDVVIWDAKTGKRLYTYTQMNDAVRALAWSPNGKYIVAGGDCACESGGHNYAKVWQAAPLP